MGQQVTITAVNDAVIRTIYLEPGTVCFDDAPLRIWTLLGSCVAITLWHPVRRLGGMCHFVLPERPTNGASVPGPGRYGTEAFQTLLTAASRHGTLPREYHAGVFGGGDMFATIPVAGIPRIGQRNIDWARELLIRHRFRIMREDAGGPYYRKVSLDLSTGVLALTRRPAHGSTVPQNVSKGGEPPA